MDAKHIKTKGKAVPLDICIGQNLRLFRELAGLTQEQLASRVDITFQQLQKNENGTNRISASRLHEFARILGRDINDFYEGFEGNYKNEDIKFIHTVQPEMKQLIQRISTLKDAKRRKRIIKAFIAFVSAIQEMEPENV